MGKHAQSVDTLLLARIQEHRLGWVFTPVDFMDLGSRTAVSTALKRYKASGTIRRLGRGLYDTPRKHPKLGILWPKMETLTDAIKRRDSVRLQPTGAYAANLLGLSEQVPMRVLFLTDGPERKINLGNLKITFKHTTPRNMATAGRISGSVIQALRWLGRHNVDDKVVGILCRKLPARDRHQLLSDMRYAPAWIGDVMRRVVDQESS
ncbi:DUF6088 family protein [Elusimicrobiota bacterium]